MRKTFLIILIALVGSLCHAQNNFSMNYEIRYEVNYHIDSTDFSTQSTEILYLFSNSKESVFMSYPKAFEKEIKEELRHQLKTTGQLNISKDYSSNFPKIFYKNFTAGRIQTIEKIDSKNYLYEEDELPLTWEITEETKEGLGYTLQKATTHFAGRDYTAWFSLDLPISDGPYLFSGLPGLIVELYDAEKHYHFVLKEMKKLKEEREFEIPKAEKISKKEFLALQEKASQNSKNNTMNLPGFQMKIVNDDRMSQEQKMDNREMQRKIKENKSRKNNLIEIH